MAPEFQKAADLLAGCLRRAADCVANGGSYEEALGESAGRCLCIQAPSAAADRTRAGGECFCPCSNHAWVGTWFCARPPPWPPASSGACTPPPPPPAGALRVLEERWHLLGALCPVINSSWGENEVLTSDMLVGTLFSLGTRVGWGWGVGGRRRVG